MTAHGMCGRFEIFESARHFRIEFESGLPIRIRIESRSFAGPYCRVTVRVWVSIAVRLGLGLQIVVYKLLENVTKCGSVT